MKTDVIWQMIIIWLKRIPRRGTWFLVRNFRYIFDWKFRITNMGERILVEDPGIQNGDIMTMTHVSRYRLYGKTLERGMKILDIGCGLGYGAYYLSDLVKEVHALDIDKKAIKYNEKKWIKENLFFYTGSCFNLDFSDSSFDSVFSSELIEHFEESLLSDFLSEVYRVLKPGGTFFISTPNAPSPEYNFISYYHKAFYSEHNLPDHFDKFFSTYRIVGQNYMHDDKPINERFKELNDESYHLDNYFTDDTKPISAMSILVIGVK